METPGRDWINTRLRLRVSVAAIGAGAVAQAGAVSATTAIAIAPWRSWLLLHSLRMGGDEALTGASDVFGGDCVDGRVGRSAAVHIQFAA